MNPASLGTKSSMPYGIRSVRQMKQCKRRSDRATKVISDSHVYFTQFIDPIVARCITYLLCVQSDDVPNSMLEFLKHLRDGTEKNPMVDMNMKKTEARSKNNFGDDYWSYYQ